MPNIIQGGIIRRNIPCVSIPLLLTGSYRGHFHFSSRLAIFAEQLILEYGQQEIAQTVIDL